MKKINNKTYYITKSTRVNKKYDVYDSNFKRLTSFGDKRYQQYHDRFGLYSSQDHWIWPEKDLTVVDMLKIIQTPEKQDIGVGIGCGSLFCHKL